MPQIIVCEWRIIFSENLLHKISYPVKDPCSYQVIWYLTSIANYRSLVTGCLMVAALSTDFLSMTSSSSPWSVVTNLSISIIPLRSFFLSDRKFTRSVQSLNIPYGIWSIVCEASCHQIITSSGHQVCRSYCHTVIVSYCHTVITIFNIAMNNEQTN